MSSFTNHILFIFFCETQHEMHNFQAAIFFSKESGFLLQSSKNDTHKKIIKYYKYDQCHLCLHSIKIWCQTTFLVYVKNHGAANLNKENEKRSSEIKFFSEWQFKFWSVSHKFIKWLHKIWNIVHTSYGLLLFLSLLWRFSELCSINHCLLSWKTPQKIG